MNDEGCAPGCPPARPAPYPPALKEFNCEMSIWCRLVHPNITQFLGVGYKSGAPPIMVGSNYWTHLVCMTPRLLSALETMIY